MNAADRQRLIAEVRSDVKKHEDLIAGLRQTIIDTEQEVEELKRVERYLLRQSVHPGSATGEPDALPVEPPIFKALDAITAERIEEVAADMMHDRNGSVQALEVARKLVPEYTGELDGRKFEKRVYSTIERAEEKFVKVGRGQWALQAHIVGTNFRPVPVQMSFEDS